MKKFDVKAVAELKEVFVKAQYIKRVWKTEDKYTMSLQEYAELIDPMFKHVSGNPTIIAKERKDGNIFIKMQVPLKGGSSAEFDLSYENDFDEGDVIDKDSLYFSVETFLDKKHGYASGKIL